MLFIIISAVLVGLLLLSLTLHTYLVHKGLGVKSATFKEKRNALLCIAHPDDEVMFFAPTLMSLIKESGENNVFILCLSTGNSS